MGAYEQAAEARMAAAKAADAAYKADIAKINAANPVLDEQTKIAGAKAAIDAATKAGIPTVAPTPTPVVAETAAERLARITAARVTGGGTEPPYEAPAGTHWSFMNGAWKLYKDSGAPVTTKVAPKPGDPDYVDPNAGNPDPLVKPSGTPPAYVYNAATKTWEQPPKPTTAAKGNWVWDDAQGWTDSTVVEGAGGSQFGSEKILAKDTFKNTLALFFGPAEMSQQWVDDIYKVISGYYKTGSTVDEALNMAVQEARGNPALTSFTKRFKGLYDLQDLLVKGKAVTVPTVAEFFKSESAMGDVLREAGMGDIATQEFLGEVLGKGKSVFEVTNLITKTFASIDNAPDALKKTLGTYFPMLSRVDLAKGLLLGTEGAAALDKKIKAITVLSAANTQNVNMDLASAGDIAALGYNYLESLSSFGTVKELGRADTLASFEGEKYTQQEAINNVFSKDFAAQEKARLLKEKELARWKGSSGLMASSLRSSKSSIA